MGSFGEEIPTGSIGHAEALGALKDDEALPLVEVGGERGEVEHGEEGPLRGGVDAGHDAGLPLMNLVVKQPAVARLRIRNLPCKPSSGEIRVGD